MMRSRMNTVNANRLPAADGPWESVGKIISTRRGEGGYPIETDIVSVTDGRGRAVAAVYAGFGDGPATARLVSAAPQLYAALKKMLELYEAGAWSNININDAKRALAKAE